MQSHVKQAILEAQVSGLERLSGTLSSEFVLTEVERLEVDAGANQDLRRRLMELANRMAKEEDEPSGPIWGTIIWT